MDNDKTEAEYLYPGDLVDIITRRWQGLQEHFALAGKKTKARLPDDAKPATSLESSNIPFPDPNSLKLILDTIYHASFLTEESRRIAVRVAYLIPEHPSNNVFISHNVPITLQNPTLFNVSNVLKLAPALQATESIITICPRNMLDTTITDSKLMIWGIWHLGSEWENTLTAKRSGAIAPPNCLTISTFSPGSLAISTLGIVLARLREGKLIGMPLEDLGHGQTGRFFQEAADALYSDTCAKLNTKIYTKKEDSDKYPRHLYYQTIAQILHFGRERGHGSTFIIIPDEVSLEDNRLTDRVSIKYQIKSFSIWQTLIREAEAHRKYFDLLFPDGGKYLPDNQTASVEDLKDLIRWEKGLKGAQESILEFSSFVSSLSIIDGAVVLSKRLNVLGFGAEITATSPSLKSVIAADDPEGHSGKRIPIINFGTRHRSAIRLCSSFEDCICLVISHEGMIRAIKRVGADVFLWNDVSLSRFTL